MEKVGHSNLSPRYENREHLFTYIIYLLENREHLFQARAHLPQARAHLPQARSHLPQARAHLPQARVRTYPKLVRTYPKLVTVSRHDCMPAFRASSFGQKSAVGDPSWFPT
jgi:hypothetical protein